MASNFGSSRENKEELRIVLVGKTGIGKSATGNTILGRQFFESKFSAKSMTVDCTKRKAEVDGQQVAVIDTPGLFDTRFGKDKTTKDISQCISYAVPGPHVFLVVIMLGRYTEEEKQTVQRIQEIFGQAANRYSMVLFTHGDQLETTIEDFLTESSELQELVDRCNGQYHVFNNKLKDRSQVTELLQKIRDLVQKNGGSHYTNEMFKEAEKAIEEEKQRILKEKEEQIRKEKEEVERKLQEKYEKEMKKMNEQFQVERERERKEREEERKREMERWEMERKEREEERKREKERWEMERKEREEERKREKETWEMERERGTKRWDMERERETKRWDMTREKETERWDMERKEREEERRCEREKQEMNEERKREKEEKEAERKREREDKDREMMKDMMMNNMNEQHVRELRREREKLQSRHETEAREKAEEFNPLFPLLAAGGVIVGAGEVVVEAGKSLAKGFKGLGRKIASWF